MRKAKKILISTIITAILIVSAVSLASCVDKEEKIELLDLTTVDYLDEINESGNLEFEWLHSYNPNRPTMILFHGETTDSKPYSIELDSDEYTFYDADTKATGYVIDKASNGYNNSGFNLDLSYYWINVAEFNVAIFHWEGFTYDDTDSIMAKLYTVPKMRYRDENGDFETERVPKTPLAEIITNLYIEEMDGKKINNEIRFVSNGIGCNLAVSIIDLLDKYNENNLINDIIIPDRLALNDPYLTSTNMYMEIPWDKDIDTENGTLGVFDNMLSDVTDNGTVVEMIESVTSVASTEKVVDENGEESEIIVYSQDYSYALNRSTAKTKELFDSIASKTAYLKMTQNYSVQFSEGYINKHRIALDWYLTSVFGSDDTGIGYNIGSEGNQYNNGGNRSTRPILNDRYANDDISSAAAQQRGFNYGVSAWTPTVYTRALRGIKFSLKERTSNASSDVHDNMRYNYKDYRMQYFRTENYQKSDQDDYTIVAGYIYLDKNADGYINDGASNGLGGETVYLDIQSKTGKAIASLETKTSNDGFYVFKLADKNRDESGDLSEEGYSFSGSGLSMVIKYYISSTKYVYQSTMNSGIYYDTVAAQHFSTEKVEFTLKSYYADAITIKNCLLKPEVSDEAD